MNNLKRIRKARILTQKDVAEHLGISVTTYSRYENGKIKLTEDVLVKLIHFYSISADYLLGITNFAYAPIVNKM